MGNILLGDDHSIIRTGLKMMIEDLIPGCSVDEAANGKEIKEKILSHPYNLLMLDVNMPETDTVQLVTDLLEAKPTLKILMFSMNAEELYAKKYLSLGTKGYISKDSPGDEIKKAILTVLDNKTYTSDAFKETLVNNIGGNGNASNPFSCLSDREFEIVQLLLNGDSGIEISNKLSLQPSTVGTHRARIFKKLNCETILDLYALAKLHM